MPLAGTTLGIRAWHSASTVRSGTGATAMDNAEEPYDLITVLSRLEGIGREIDRSHPVRDDDLGATATRRMGLFQKMLRSLRSRRFWTDGSASHKS